MLDQSHRLPVTVYYEDTDAGGVVYHASYLRFAERGRTEWLRGAGWGQRELDREWGVFFVVRQCVVDFLAPALLDDALIVATRLQAVGPASLALEQRILRDGGVICALEVRLACIDRGKRPTRLPHDLRLALRSGLCDDESASSRPAAMRKPRLATVPPSMKGRN